MTGTDVQAAVDVLKGATSLRPRILVVLGSGLGRLLGDLAGSVSVPLGDLPGMSAPGVAGHEGALTAGRWGDVPVWIQAGRLHLYEGHPPSRVSAPIRVASELGVERVILTNAAGGIRPDLEAGSLVVLSDLLDLSLQAPRSDVPAIEACPSLLSAGADPLLADTTSRPTSREIFDPELRDLASAVARAHRVPLFRGVYAGVLGPSFETPAEIRMIARLGGDVVGMSTVPEARTARALGLRTLGLSLVTNRAAGLRPGALSHDEVVRAARERGGLLVGLVRELVGALGSGTTGSASEGGVGPRSD